VPMEQDLLTPEQLVDVTIKEIEKPLPPAWGVKQFENQLLTPNGATIRQRRYQGTVDSVAMDFVCVARYQDAFLFSFFGNTPTAQRAQTWPVVSAVLGSLTVTGDAGVPAAVVPPQQRGEPLPAGWEITGNGPLAWKLAATPVLATFQGPDNIRLTVKQYDRVRVHADLNASETEALRQLRATPTAKLLRQEPATVAGVPARVVEFSYDLNGKAQRMMQVLVATKNHLYWAGFTGSTDAFTAQLPAYQAFLTGLTVTATASAAITPAQPATPTATTPPAQTASTPLVQPAGMGVQFELPTDWQIAVTNGSVVYTAPGASPTRGATVTVRRIPRTQQGYATAADAGRTLRAGMPRTATVLTMTGGQHRGITYNLNDYRVSLDDKLYQHRRVYYLEFPGALVELTCQVETNNLFDREKIYTAAKPVFDTVIETLAPAQ